MAGNFLLDTNAVIALSAGDSVLQAIIKDVSEILVPAHVLGELYFGAENSARVEENLKRVDVFAQSWAVLAADNMTARHYGRVKHQLRKKGYPIPENDIWIAATALQHGLTLVTRDKHFREVDGLTIKTW